MRKILCILSCLLVAGCTSFDRNPYDGALRELAGSDIRISKLRGGAVCRTCDGGQPQQQSEFPHDNLFINLNSNIPSADTALSARRAAPERPDTTAYSATPRTIRTLSGSCRGSVSGASAHPPRRNPHRIRHTPASSPPGYPPKTPFRSDRRYDAPLRASSPP